MADLGDPVELLQIMEETVSADNHESIYVIWKLLLFSVLDVVIFFTIQPDSLWFTPLGPSGSPAPRRLSVAEPSPLAPARRPSVTCTQPLSPPPGTSWCVDTCPGAFQATPCPRLARVCMEAGVAGLDQHAAACPCPQSAGSPRGWCWAGLASFLCGIA